MEILEIVTVDSKKTTARWKTGKPCVRWFAIIGKVRSPKPRRTRQCQALGNFRGGRVYAHGDFSSGMEEGEKEEEEGGFSALKKLMDIRWIENLRSSAWKLS